MGKKAIAPRYFSPKLSRWAEINADQIGRKTVIPAQAGIQSLLAENEKSN